MVSKYRKVRRKFNDFARGLFKGERRDIDLSEYKNEAFVKQIQVQSLEHVQEIFTNIHTEQMRKEINRDPKIFELKKVINQEHEETGLTCLDYCVISGDKDLAQRLLALGSSNCETINITKFKEELLEEFGNDRPEIIDQIIDTIKYIEAHKEEYGQYFVDREYTFWDKTKSATWRHKYAIIMFVGGIVLVGVGIGVPFTAPVTLPIGLGLVGGTLGSIQSTRSNMKNNDIVAESGRVWEEAEAIREMMDFLHDEIEDAKKSNHNHIVVINQQAAHGADESEILHQGEPTANRNRVLYALERKHEEIQEREDALFKNLKLTRE